jgi:SAM-dependent methyltransferase
MPDYVDMQTIQADFDRLALLSDEGWNHNNHYHNFLLRHVPPHSGDVLEIGCGTGAFARLLAERADHVTALDLSPQMIRIARERSKQYPEIDYEIADVLSRGIRGYAYQYGSSTCKYCPAIPQDGSSERASRGTRSLD